MIPLTNNSSGTTQVLQISLGGSASTTYPTCTVCSYIVQPQAKTVTSANGSIAADPSEYRSAPEFTLLASASATTIAAAPPSGSVKDIHNVTIYNADTASATVTVSILDNVTTRVLKKVTLLTLESLNYDNGRGWYAMDANGNIKEATASNFGDITATGLTLNGGTKLTTFSESSFTGTVTGVSGSVTGSVKYVKTGNQVTLRVPSLSGTSNSTSKTITGAPSAIFPAVTIRGFALASDNGGGNTTSIFDIGTDGVITCYFGIGGNFTASGTAGIGNFSITYTLA